MVDRLAGRCLDHSAAADASDRRRDGKRFLDSAAWRRLRKVKLLRNAECELCQQVRAQPVPAVDVDHILPRHTHPHLALSIDNLQSLCKRCHSRKTAQES